MEIIAALNRNNEKTALEKKIRKETKKTSEKESFEGEEEAPGN
jgi:hypothetical protein